MNKLEELLDSRKGRELAESIERMADSVERIARKIDTSSAGVNDAAKNMTKASEKAVASMATVATDMGKAAVSLTDASEIADLTSSLLLTRTDHMVGSFQQAMRKLKEDGATIVAELARDLHESPERLMNSMVSSITRRAPGIGAALDFLISSGIEQSRRETEMRQRLTGFADIQTFSGIDLGAGPLGLRQTGTELARRGTNLTDLGLGAKDLQAQLDALQKSGQRLGEAFRTGYNTVFARMPDDALGFAQEIDTSFGQTSGTAMRLAGDFAKMTDVGLKPALETVNRMSGAARLMSEQFSVVQSNVAQATQALRVQGSSADSLLITYKRMSDAIKSMTPGMGEARQRELGGQAFKDIASALGSHSDPLSGVLYQTIGRLMGVDVSRYGGENILMQMQTGFQFAQKAPGGLSFDAAKLAALGSQFYSPNLSQEELAIRYNRIGGIGATGSMALAQMMIASGGDIEALMRNKTMLGKFEEEAAAAREAGEKMAPLNTDTFQTTMNQIKELMQSIGEGILTVLGSIARVAMNPMDFDIRDVERRRVSLALGNIGDKFESLSETSGNTLGRLSSPVQAEGAQLRALELKRALDIAKKAEKEGRKLTDAEMEEVQSLYGEDISKFSGAVDTGLALGVGIKAAGLGAAKGAAVGMATFGPPGALVGLGIGGAGGFMAGYGATSLLSPASRFESYIERFNARNEALVAELQKAFDQVNTELGKSGVAISVSVTPANGPVAAGVTPVQPGMP
jgi:hypothetical protein